MNPFSCAYLGRHNNKCRYTPDQVARYKAKISGPLLVRIHIHIEVVALSEDVLTKASVSDRSQSYRISVEAAREIQLDRQSKSNKLLNAKEIQQFCVSNDASMQLLK